jgi:ABC-type transport system involved in multi-copper enzyme maturation permease subunit
VKILPSIKFILKSLLSERATGLFLVLSVIFLTLSLSLSDINIAVKYRLLEDALSASQSFIMTIFAIFYAFSAMEKERKGGLFVFVLAGGNTRGEYLLSQFAALFSLVLIVFCAFFVVDFVFLGLLGGGMGVEFFYKLLFSSLASSLLGFLTLTLARFVSNTNAIIYAIFLFFIGSGADELALYAQDKNMGIGILTHIVYYVLPNFSFFDPLAVNTAFSKELFAVLYFVLYSAVLFFAAFYRFKKEVLKVG